MDALEILNKKARNKKIIGAGVLLVGLTLGIVGSIPITDTGYTAEGYKYTASGPLNVYMGLFGFAMAGIGAIILAMGYLDDRRIRKLDGKEKASP